MKMGLELITEERLMNYLIKEKSMNLYYFLSNTDIFLHVMHCFTTPEVSKGSEVVDVVGPICESGDFLAQDRELPVVKSGDLLALLSAGAYGFVMSSNYNTRPRVAEVLLKGSEFSVVREREPYEELLSLERIPEFI